MNPDGSGAPLAASVILPVSPAGVTIDAQAGGHVVVDIVGWFTGASEVLGDEGLFVPTAPTRLLTRVPRSHGCGVAVPANSGHP